MKVWHNRQSIRPSYISFFYIKKRIQAFLSCVCVAVFKCVSIWQPSCSEQSGAHRAMCAHNWIFFPKSVPLSCTLHTHSVCPRYMSLMQTQANDNICVGSPRNVFTTKTLIPTWTRERTYLEPACTGANLLRDPSLSRPSLIGCSNGTLSVQEGFFALLVHPLAT